MSGGNAVAGDKLFKMGINTGTHWAEAAKARQIAPEHAAIVKGLFNVDKKIEGELGRGASAFGYLEAHIKAPKLEDIESINIPRSYAAGLFRGNVDQGDYQALLGRLQRDPEWKDKINITDNDRA